MSSLTTHESLAIRLSNVSKTYRLHGSQRDQLIDVLGLQRLGFKTKTPTKEFSALMDISLDVPRGHRIGIVGRNGAGKTTLLKLICGNFAPTSGTVAVNGTVQALMNVGLGFHPEYTGRDNVAAALQYNGLGRHEYQAAMEDIVEFCELGDFIDQPFKTYSLGMQARLMFAAATAIRPDILIVDEVLGAGDAYFVAKSKARVERLVNSGCTMLLVSHSMQQILELCTEAVWLDNGRIRMQDDAFLVVKAYEEYLHGPVKRVELAAAEAQHNDPTTAVRPTIRQQVQRAKKRLDVTNGFLCLQEPPFLPHQEELCLEHYTPNGFEFEAPGGVSRWDSEAGLKLTAFSVVTERGVTNKLVSMRPAKFVFVMQAEDENRFSCRYGIAIHDHHGSCVTRILSPCDHFDADKGESRTIEVTLNPCQLGPGEYTLGISVLQYVPIEELNLARRYDLLSRSFAIRVELPDSLAPLSAEFFHTAEWNFETAIPQSDETMNAISVSA